jgi:hypothetical protein
MSLNGIEGEGIVLKKLAVESVDQGQKSESTGGNSRYRWNVLVEGD